MKCLFRFTPYLLVILALVLVFPLFCSCSGEDSSNRFLQLLKLVPSEVADESSPIYLIDRASFYEDNGISLVTNDNQPVSYQEFVEIMSEMKEEKQLLFFATKGSYITGLDRYAEIGPIKNKNVGYDCICLDAEILAGAPPYNVVAAIGRYDPQAARDDLCYQDEWHPSVVEAYTAEEYRGVTIHNWGDGLEINLKRSLTPPHVDLSGSARPLVVTEKYLFYAPTMEIMKSMIDASQSKTESLADLPEYADIANGLHDFNCYSAIVVDESLVNFDVVLHDLFDSEAETRLKDFVTCGQGISEDENGIFIVLVICHESAEEAEANVSLLEQRIAGTDSINNIIPWIKIITDYEIWTEGNVLLAKLFTSFPRFGTD